MLLSYHITIPTLFEKSNDEDKEALFRSARSYIVLIHGMTSALQTFSGISAQLADALQSPVIAVSLRGHGTSPEPSDITHYDNGSCAADVLETLVNLGAVLASPDKKQQHHHHHHHLVVLGHSWGSRVALKFAELWPDLIRTVISEDEYLRADTPDKIASRNAGDLAVVAKEAAEMRSRWVPSADFESKEELLKWFHAVAGDPARWGFPEDAGYSIRCGQRIATISNNMNNNGDEKTKHERVVFFPLFKPHADLVWNYYCMRDSYEEMLADAVQYPFYMHVQCGDEACGADVSTADYEAMRAIAAKNPGMRSVTKIAGAGHGIHKEKPAEFIADVVAAVKRSWAK